MSQSKEHDNFMNYIERRLEHWAEWHSTGNYYGVGFHSETIEYVLMTVGIMVKSTGIKPLPCDEDAEEIEMLISEMSVQNNELANALRIQYLYNGSTRTKSKEFRIPRPHLTRLTDMARQWLAGRLSATNKFGALQNAEKNSRY